MSENQCWPIQYCCRCGSHFVSREPWYTKPAANDSDTSWGYLYQCPHGHLIFDNSTIPTEEEVATRSGCRFIG